MNRFSLATEVFSGPLDALLTLIEERKLSISQVTLAEICDAYFAYVEKLEKLPLGETAQFVLIASTLLLIKSRTLLPTLELSGEEEQSIEELERRLARYATVRKASKLLQKQWGIVPLLFPRRAPLPEHTHGTRARFNPGETTIARVHAALMRLVHTFPATDKFAEATVAPIVSLEETLTRLKRRLGETLRARWSELTKSASKHETIVHFLAILELIRHGSVSATQEKLFSDILLETESVGVPRY